MQSITVLSYIKTRPTISSSGNTQTAIFTAEVAAYKDKDPPMVLRATVQGAAAAGAAANIQENTYWILSGQFKICRDQPLEFEIQKFDPVSAPVGLPGTNHVTLVGRAGRDPEVRYFESGSMVANLSLAVNRRSRDDEPDWFNLEIWGKQGQVAGDYVRKGSLLGIIGSFKLDRWTDRSSGEERTKPVIRVDRLELLGSKRDAAGGPDGGGAGGYSSDEEVPF
jgi:single-strand DNA-binding protein